MKQKVMQYIIYYFIVLFAFTACTNSSSSEGISCQFPCKEKKSHSFDVSDTEKIRTVSEVIGNGAFIVLSDNSVWAIAPFDIVISAEWLTPAEIIVKPSNHPLYPYLLYNSITQENIYASKSSFQEIRQHIQKTQLEQQEQQQQQEKVQEKQKQLDTDAAP